MSTRWRRYVPRLHVCGHLQRRSLMVSPDQWGRQSLDEDPGSASAALPIVTAMMGLTVPLSALCSRSWSV